MLRTVKDACILHETAIDFSMKDQIEDLHQLIGGEKDGAAFFEKNYITHGMAQLFRRVSSALPGNPAMPFFSSPRRWAEVRLT